jgi:two-component system, chemotaxis family, protein-glutamate methylesterase/glutaminase
VPRAGQDTKGVSTGNPTYDVVVVGASWGGLNALSTIVGGLPPEFDIPVIIIQHRSKDSENLLAELLQDETSLIVSEVEDKEPLAPGHVYVAPADYHLLLEDGHFSLSTEQAVRYSRPSIDVTFTSSADSYGARAIGVVLTGANDDGSRGLKRIVERGGLAIVQDPATAEVATMPAAALAAVPAARVVALASIADELARLAGKTTATTQPRPSGRAGRRGSKPGGEIRA